MPPNYLQKILNDLLGIDNNTSATIIITLIIFGIGLIFTQISKSIGSYIQRKRVKRICSINFESLEIGIKKESKAYQNLIESLRFENKHGWDFSQVHITSLDALREFGYINIYNAYFTGVENIFSRKIKLKAFQKFWSTLVIIPLWQKTMKSFINDQLKNYNEWNGKRIDSLMAFNKLCDSYIYQFAEKLIDDINLKTYILELDNIRVNLQNQADFTNPETIENILVQPVLKLNRNTKNIEIIHEFNKFLLSTSLGYRNMKQILETSQNQTLSFYHDFRGREKLIRLVRRIL